MIAVRPSHALVVRSETSISECVRKMRDEKVGSLLVIGSTQPVRLVGIFTERDLLLRIEEIHHGEYWDKPVSLLMSKPVKTLSVLEVDRAAEFMLQNRIRHVPIIYTDEFDRQHIAGVVSIRDVLGAVWRKYDESQSTLARGKLGQRRQLSIGLVTKDPVSRQMLAPILSQGGRARVIELTYEQVLLRLSGVDFVVLDLDRAGSSEWSQALKELVKISRENDGLEGIILIFDPSQHDAKIADLFRKLGKSEKISVFAKPLNLLELFQRMNFELALSKR